MRDQPITLPSSAVSNSASLYGFRLDGSRWGFTLAQMLEEGALKAERYELHMQPGMFGLLVAKDGWTWVRYASRHPLGHMILEPAVSGVSSGDEDPEDLPSFRPRGRPRKHQEELA